MSEISEVQQRVADGRGHAEKALAGTREIAEELATDMSAQQAIESIGVALGVLTHIRDNRGKGGIVHLESRYEQVSADVVAARHAFFSLFVNGGRTTRDPDAREMSMASQAAEGATISQRDGVDAMDTLLRNAIDTLQRGIWQVSEFADRREAVRSLAEEAEGHLAKVVEHAKLYNPGGDR